MALNKIWVLIGFLCAVFSVCVFLYMLGRNQNAKNTKVIYVLVLLTHLYFAAIYGLTVIGVLAMTEYGNYIRPGLSMIILSPLSIALAHRKSRQ